MEAKIKELKQTIEDTETSLKDPAIKDDAELVKLLEEELDKTKKELEKLETELVKKASEASDKLEQAKEKGDKKGEKKAKQALAEVNADAKEAGKLSDKVENAEEKVEKIKKHGGFRPNAGRKRDPNKVVKPKGQRGGKRHGAGRKPIKFKKTIKAVSKVKSRKLMKPTKAELVKKSKEKTVKAFGQTIVFKDNAEFCSKLIKAFKKRRSVYKKSRKRTKPVFAVITSGTANLVHKALDNVSAKQIQNNPKKVMADLKNAEKKAKDFLESLKPLMGSDYKHSEIAKEFGEIEEAIKKVFAKYQK